MKKHKRNPNSQSYDYCKHTASFNGVQIHENCEEYYGIHRDGGRVKIDIRRMKKVKTSGVPDYVLEYASSIPRHTTYYLPKRIHRYDYVSNQFRDKLKDLRKEWSQFKRAFETIETPLQRQDRATVSAIVDENMEIDDAQVKGILSAVKYDSVYKKMIVSQSAQFIHQMATELDALMLRKCVYLGFAEKEVSRGKMHTYLNGTMRGIISVERLKGYDEYLKFFTVWNLLKHNSEDLFEKVKARYPEMLLTDTYRNGELSQYYLKIGSNYIESMLDNLQVFYDSLCENFFDERIDEVDWNYDDYFAEKVKEIINEF